jgi:hypothetical protein
MEAGVKARPLLLILGLVLLLRLPFLNQAVQGDDRVYLAEASHAQVEPLHPDRVDYVFRGRTVDLRGLTHPPLDGWILAGLLAIFGSVKEVPFHAAYMVFSLIAAASMWSLARRFSDDPLWATLLFLAVPTFVVNGTSFETDVPFAAFWMAAIALFCADRLALAALAMVLASLTAYQTVVLIPILAVYCWLYRRGSRKHWLTLLTPALVFVAWQVFERVSTGELPAGVLSGYFTIYQTLQAKLVNALALGPFLVPDFPGAGAVRVAVRLAQATRTTDAVSGGLDRHLSCLRAGDFLRRVGAIPASDSRSHGHARGRPAPPMAGHRVRPPDGSQFGARRHELPALERLPRVRRVARSGNRESSRLGGR